MKGKIYAAALFEGRPFSRLHQSAFKLFCPRALFTKEMITPSCNGLFHRGSSTTPAVP